ncbi:lipocalin-like domain-containing protein [Caulobacter sp. SSI4214]|uniref:lipocalin-like domain-containing protein n=1 Tax=Caulobacter sp. SSI4214 TaxID=2575739 RepID=UPI00143C7F9D|nr:lipocalin-like domain-containing protein [Caulobacter sp. SSI4214]
MTKINRQQLVGAWLLASYVEQDMATGVSSFPMGEHPKGVILYTPDGYMSAQLAKGERARFASDDVYAGRADEYEQAGQSYLAYSGRYFVDDATGRLEHEMFVSFFPNWQGQRQVRVARIDGDMLYLAPAEPMPFNGGLKMAYLAWRRAPAHPALEATGSLGAGRAA